MICPRSNADPRAQKTAASLLHLLRAGALAHAFVLMFAVVSVASGQQIRGGSLRIDNDFLAIRGREHPPDYDYTSGLRAEIVLAPQAKASQVVDSSGYCQPGKCLMFLAVGQEIYTPRLDGHNPMPGERAYAGWLYAQAAINRVAGKRSQMLELKAGWIGPEALGEEVQNTFHRLVGSRLQEGWSHQLNPGPGMMLSYRESAILRLQGREPRLDLLPHVRATVGNVERSIGAGLEIRICGCESNSALYPFETPFAIVGTEAAWKQHDVFLDTAPNEAIDPVVRAPLLATLRLGFGHQFRAWVISYTFVIQSREYKTQRRGHRYGSIAIAVFPTESH